LPYGNGLSSYAPTALPQCVDATEQHYTGKERDTESGNDYFEARYYASSFGRFMSPDWSAKEEPVPYAKLDDPQSLNLYAYVEDNPSGRTDPSGHACKDGNFQCQLSAAWNKTHEIVNMVIAKISPAPKVPAPAQKPGQAPVSPVAGVLPPAADGAATAAKYATRRMPKLSPRAIPREVPGSDPVPRQVPPGEVPEISPGASTLEKLGIAALNLVKMLGNTTTDLIPPIYIPKDITRPSGCGAIGHECTI